MAGIDEALIVQEGGSAKTLGGGVASLALVARVHGKAAEPVALIPIG